MSNDDTSNESNVGTAGALILLLLGLGCGGLVALSPDIGLPLAIMMLPGLIYLIIDRSSGWAVARAILLFQAAACVGPISGAWYQCSGIDGCMSLLATSTTILRVWLAGGGGWLLTQVVPIGLKVLNEIRLRRYQQALETRRQSLRTEWGIDRTSAD